VTVVRAGDVVDNPVTRESIRFVATGVETDGERIEMELTMFAGGFVPVLHVHPQQVETFNVLAGRPRFTVSGVTRDASPGEELVVQPGTPHIFCNPTGEDVRIGIEFRPALRTDQLFVTLAALANTGKLNRRGIPRNPLVGALFAHVYRNELRPASPLLRLANAFAAPGARLAKAFGLRLPGA
jgi:quercetin dioxygenase-like cupin family protein